MTNKRKKLPPYDWRRIAAYLREHPGTWYDIPRDLPLLHPTRVQDGGYKDSFFPPGAFEVDGWNRGTQRARYVGDADPMQARARYGEALARGEDVQPPDLATIPRHVQMTQWWLERGTWNVTGPGFTVLPLDDAPPEAPIVMRESVVEPEPDPLDDEWTIRLGGRSHWPAIAESCRNYPGQWHRILGRWTSHAAQIRRGKIAAFRPVDEWEARTRDYELEVRYIGGEVTP